MKKIINILVVLILLTTFVSAGNIETGAFFDPPLSDRDYTFYADLTTDFFQVDDYCLNVTSREYCYYNDFTSPGNFSASSYTTPYNIEFNVSYIPTGYINCLLYVNGTTAAPPYHFNDANLTKTINYTFSSDINETLNFYAICQDDKVTFDVFNFSTHILVDTINPAIVTNFDNNSVHLIDNLTAQFNFSDNRDLYSWNISIDGTPHAGAENVGYNFYSYNLSLDPEEYSSGEHYLVARTADGHTKHKIKDYEIDQPFWSWDEITYNIDNKGNSVTIKPEVTNWLDTFTTEKKVDRYSFTYQPSDKSSQKYKKGSLSFIIESTQPIEIRYNPLVKEVENWIITGDNWVDFVVVNDSKAKSRYTKLNDYSVRVDVTNIKDPSKVTFNSIGELNIVTQNYTFYMLNTTRTYETPVPERSDTNFSFTVETGGSPVDVTNIEADFLYNGTLYTVAESSTATEITFTTNLTTPSVDADTNLSVFWNVTYNSVAHNTSDLQLVQNLGLRYCNGTNDTAAVRFNIYDEEFETLIPEVDLNLHVSFSSIFSDVQFGFNFSGNNSYEICVDPADANYTIDAVMEFEADGYSHRKYYLFETSLDSDTDNVTLYLINSSKASDVIIKVYDQSVGSPTEDAIVKVLRYFPELDDGTGNAYKLVEVAKTDGDGQALTDLVFADVWYKFLIEYPQGTTLSETDIQRILSTSVSLPISLTGDAFEQYDEIVRIDGDVVCTRSTQTCRFTWNNVANTNVVGQLRIYQNTGITKALIHSSQSTAASGSLVHVIVGDATNKIYEAEGWVEVND